MTTIDQYKGCFLGGAVGDALGAAIEFDSLGQILARHGEHGLTEYAPAYGRKGAITDDTQMLLFTAEGLILSRVRPDYEQGEQAVAAVYHALLRWLYTQDTRNQGQLVKTFGSCAIIEGVLTGHKELFSQRAPGNSCLSALRTGKMGTMDNPINNSKGCGGVMRIAPVGFAYKDAEKAFQIGCECAAITHGHPTGYLASGYLAALVTMLAAGDTLTNAVTDATLILKTRDDHEECLDALDKAVNLAQSTSAPSPQIVEELGEGWIAEEALAISLYCALVAGDDFRKGALLAVNHSGDSDSTGAIFGNILGAIYGTSIIPRQWLDELELKDVIEEVACDLFDQFA